MPARAVLCTQGTLSVRIEALADHSIQCKTMKSWAIVGLCAVLCRIVSCSTGAIDHSIVKSRGDFGYVEVRSGAHMFW
jgi:hypothetical protein